MPYSSVSINPQQAIAQIQQAKQLGLQDAGREIDFLKNNMQTGLQLGGQLKDYMDRKQAIEDYTATQSEQLGAPVQQVEARPTVSWESSAPQLQEDIVKEFPTEEAAVNFSNKVQLLENATPEQIEATLTPDIIKGRAEGRDMSTSENILKVNRVNPQAAKQALTGINSLLQSKGYRSLLARNPSAAKGLAEGMGIDPRGGVGNDFADKAVFTSRVRKDGTIEQGFAVYDPDNKKTTFESIEGSAPKETPEQRRERDLQAKLDLAKGTADIKLVTEPEIAKMISIYRSKGASEAADFDQLQNLESSLPALNDIVDNLKELGGVATYSKGGRAYDTISRELGFGATEGGTARAKYIATVSNEVLPLLKQTFGSAFTEREGESLKATLGDPNLSPQEKNAQLDAFIESKIRQANSIRGKLGMDKIKPKQQAKEAPKNTIRYDSEGNRIK